jgi:hypothetical protein
VLVLAQEQEVLPDLVLAKGGWVALKVLSQLADIADVLLFGGRTIIFELDQSGSVQHAAPAKQRVSLWLALGSRQRRLHFRLAFSVAVANLRRSANRL